MLWNRSSSLLLFYSVKLDTTCAPHALLLLLVFYWTFSVFYFTLIFSPDHQWTTFGPRYFNMVHLPGNKPLWQLVVPPRMSLFYIKIFLVLTPTVMAIVKLADPFRMPLKKNLCFYQLIHSRNKPRKFWVVKRITSPKAKELRWLFPCMKNGGNHTKDNS